MKNLNIFEIETRINQLATEIEYIDFCFLRTKVNQFLEFLNDQPVSQRILQSIEEDFYEFKSLPIRGSTTNWSTQKRLTLDLITTPQKQGAFGYFLIIGAKNRESRIDDNLYIKIAEDWYDSGTDYSDWQKSFNINLFLPFVRLVNWYISDNQTNNQNDFFSKSEISVMEKRLSDVNDQLEKLGLGQEILFEELQELKELLSSIKKKNWLEVLKGKIGNMVVDKVISFETITFVYEMITDDNIKSLYP